MSGYFLLLLFLPCFIEIPVVNANNEDLDQTPRSAASDLGLHNLQMSLFWDARLKWVDYKKNLFFSLLVRVKPLMEMSGN